MIKKIYLWIDDIRDPVNYINKNNEFEIIWIKSFSEFKNYINNKEFPFMIDFDHDLGINENNIEENGYDCAKFLIDYCIDNNKSLPKFKIHSMNPVGKEKINSLLTNFLKFYKTE